MQVETATTAQEDYIPDLPPDALILTSSDQATWELEKKDYNVLADCVERRRSFAPLLQSFTLKGNCYHAFTAQGLSLEETDMGALFQRADGRGLVGVAVADKVRMSLLQDLIEGVVWCHLQGTPHLSLDSKTVRLYQTEPPPGKRFGLWHLSLVGIGAGPQLVTRETPYQVGNESWPFNPPETLTGALLQGNLPGLYAWDSWSLGTLVLMIAGGYSRSPFAAEASGFKDLTFSTQAAVAKKIKTELADFSGLLTRVNQDGGGFLFRHGWVVELVVGLLKANPSDRLSVTAAREIMAGNLPSSVGGAAGNSGSTQKKRKTAKAKKEGSVAAQKARSGPLLSAEEMKVLKDAFEVYDADGSGDIDSDEIVAAMGQIGVQITPEQAKRLIAENSDSTRLDFAAFTLMCQDLVSENKEGSVAATPGASSSGGGAQKARSGPLLSAEEMKVLKDTFEVFDADGSGDIDSDEIVAAMGQIGFQITPEQAKRLIAENSDSTRLDFLEFTLMCQDLVSAARAGDSEVAVLTASSVFGPQLSSTQGEPFRSLESIISIADKGLSEVVIQSRPEGAGLRNYGEIVGFRNRADGDRWDVLVAGHPTELAVGSRHRLSAVLGVVLVKGGNHKLVVSVGGARPSADAVTADVDAFRQSYAATHPNVSSGKRLRYMAFASPFERGAGTLDVASLDLSVNGGSENEDDAGNDEKDGEGGNQEGGLSSNDGKQSKFISTAF